MNVIGEVGNPKEPGEYKCWYGGKLAQFAEDGFYVRYWDGVNWCRSKVKREFTLFGCSEDTWEEL